MWWTELETMARDLAALGGRGVRIDPSARVHPSAIIEGDVQIGPRTVVGANARIVGPVKIGADALVGDQALVRGPASFADDVRIGFCTEVKNSRLDAGVRVGPQCFVADSIVREAAYLGAQVRTSNHRLDGRAVEVMIEGRRVSSQREKLGAMIGARTVIGIQCIVLPGRCVPADSLFGPRVTIEKNLPAGRYRLAQSLHAEPAQPQEMAA